MTNNACVSVRMNDNACEAMRERVSENAHISNTHTKTNEWILDSGASRHFTNDRSILFNIKQLSDPVTAYTADGSTSFNEVGSVMMTINSHTFNLRDVAFVPFIQIESAQYLCYH